MQLMTCGLETLVLFPDSSMDPVVAQMEEEKAAEKLSGLDHQGVPSSLYHI